MCRSRLRGATVCPRCGTNLALPQSISVNAEQTLRNALRSIARGELGAARLATAQARELRLTPLVQLLPGFLEYLAKPEDIVPMFNADSTDHSSNEG